MQSFASFSYHFSFHNKVYILELTIFAQSCAQNVLACLKLVRVQDLFIFYQDDKVTADCDCPQSVFISAMRSSLQALILCNFSLQNTIDPSFCKFTIRSSKAMDHHLGRMPAERLSFAIIRQHLVTLEVIIEALLKSNAPLSPIVKEKINQVEKLIFEIPFENESTAELWRKKLARWWTIFATQQIPLLPPSEQEILAYELPRPKYSFDRTSLYPWAVPEVKPNPCYQVLNNLQWGSEPKTSRTISISSKECIPANTVLEKQAKVAPPSNSTSSTTVNQELKPTFKPVSEDFDSAPVVPKKLPGSSKKESSAAPIEVASASTTKTRPPVAVPVSSECFSKNCLWFVACDTKGDCSPNSKRYYVGHGGPDSTVPESDSDVKLVTSAFKWGKPIFQQLPALAALKELQFSGSSQSDRPASTVSVHSKNRSSSARKPKETVPPTVTKCDGHQASVSAVAESEPVFEPVPDDFDWGSAPA